MAGFSLVELLVSISIVALIMTVVISNQANYTDRANLTNLADEIGLSISQAQAYGVSTKEFPTNPGEFNASYGLTFSLLGNPAGSSLAYLYFADRGNPSNKRYDDGGNWITCTPGGASECLQKTNISGGNDIQSLCMIINLLADDCTTPRRIDISFDRPNTEAQIIFFNNLGNTYTNSAMIGARIILRSASGLTKSVLVYKTGQVSIQ